MCRLPSSSACSRNRIYAVQIYFDSRGATDNLTHRMVTIRWPSVHPIFFASLTHVTRLHALLEPRKSPSCCTRYRDMLTASASVTRNASPMMGSASSKFFVSRLIPLRVVTRELGRVCEGRDGDAHSLDDGVDLVTPFGAFGFLAVEEHAILDLRAFE